VLRLLTWREALLELREPEIDALVSDPPPRDDFASWLALAELASRAHDDVAAEGLRLRDLGAVLAGDDLSPRMLERFEALARVEEIYDAALARIGRSDPQAERISAGKSRRVREDRDIVLLGITDVGKALRDLLTAIAHRVHVLVFAPEELAERFDEWGGVRPAAWCEATISIPDDAIEVVSDPSEEAATVVERLREWGPELAVDEVVIGAPDLEVLPYLSDAMERARVPVHIAGGTPLRRTAPYRVLAALADFADEYGYRELAALARHPDVEDWLASGATPAVAAPRKLEGSRAARPTDLLVELDTWAAKHLPSTFAFGESPAPNEALELLFARLRELIGDGRGDHPLTKHARTILDILLAIYDRHPLDPRRLTEEGLLDALSELHTTIAEIQEIDGEAPRVSFSEALRFILRRAGERSIPSPPAENAVETLGWLELALDDAPTLILTGMNEGIVPSSARSDPLLPDSIRRKLGLFDSERRYARDACLLASILATRRRIAIILAKRSVRGDALAPSRLLLATDRENLPKRVLELFERPPSSPPSLMPRPGARKLAFDVPRPTRRERPRDVVSVTAFRDYLACPYGFWLRHIVGLRATDDSAEELDALAFGNLAHAVLDRFASSDAADSTDPERIATTLDRLLDEEIASTYGSRPRVVIDVQADLLRERLHAFAEWQASWTREGWRIAFSEVEIAAEHGVIIGEGDLSVRVRGRMDRIDWHPERDEWVVLD
ncbi:MAG TPA: PD-(D/E)XK nuclease family protein, partial [Planctomycetota bacterium]|nr:PD-(D/E)XK nuclease family protein [Planctomycetota bacterium]